MIHIYIYIKVFNMKNNAENVDQNHETKPIGAMVNAGLWAEVKIQAIREGRKTGEVLDDAIRMYLKTKLGA
jgi:hypothetical protein